MELRNWIEEAIGMQWTYPPVFCGYISGRPVYSIDWIDGSSKDYYIDFDNHTIEHI